MKKWLLGIMSAAILFGTSAYAADFTATSDSQAGKVAVRIKADTQRPILVYLTDDNEEGFNIENLNPLNISEKLIAFAEMSPKDGVYYSELILPDNIPSGWYMVTAEDYKAEDDISAIALSERQKRVFVAGKELVEEAISAINSAGASNIKNVLEQYKDVFSIILDEDYNSYTDTAFLALKRGEFKTFKEIQDTFEIAKAVGALKSASKSTMGDMLKKYGEVIGIETGEDYTKYSDDVHSLLNSAYSGADIDADCKEKFLKLYNETVAVAALNNADRTTITEVLEKYNDIFGLDLSGKYASTDKIEFNKALERKSFSSAAAVKTAFDTALSALNKGTNKPSDNGGGKSGTSSPGKTTTTYVPTKDDSKQPNNDKNTDDKEKIKFSDLENVAWAEEAIYALAERKIVSGYSDNSFKPNNNITRNEFITMIVLAFDLLDESAEYDFTDGDAGAWYAKYIASAKKAGILAGYEDGSFGDGENITRQDMAAIVFRMTDLDKVISENKFEDDSSIAEYAKDAVYTLNAKGIINGMGENKFEPQLLATRAQAAKIIYSVTGGGAVD